MMEQEEVTQEEEDVIDGEVVEAEGEVVEEEEVKDEQESEADFQKRLKYQAVGLFVVGFFCIFASAYIQTDNTWVLGASVVLLVACWTRAFLCMLRAFKFFHNDVNLFIFFGASGAISSYGVSSLMVENAVWFRAFSFLCLILLVLGFLERLPNLVEWCQQHKDETKALFSAKNIITAIGAVLVFLTALFQFLQVWPQIFHR